MKALVDVDDSLWAQARKGDAFPGDAEALEHLIAMALYSQDSVKISTALIFATKKIRVTVLPPEKTS